MVWAAAVAGSPPAKRRQPRDVQARGAGGQDRAHHNVLDLGRIDAGPLDGRADRVPGQRRRLDVVKSPPKGSADGGAGG